MRSPNLPKNTAPKGRTTKPTAQPEIARRTLASGTVVAASSVGLLLEWYDFFVYGILAATVLNKLFFPATDLS